MKSKSIAFVSVACLMILATGCTKEINVTRNSTGNPFFGAPITGGYGSNVSGHLQQSNTK